MLPLRLISHVPRCRHRILREARSLATSSRHVFGQGVLAGNENVRFPKLNAHPSLRAGKLLLYVELPTPKLMEASLDAINGSLIDVLQPLLGHLLHRLQVFLQLLQMSPLSFQGLLLCPRGAGIGCGLSLACIFSSLLRKHLRLRGLLFSGFARHAASLRSPLDDFFSIQFCGVSGTLSCPNPCRRSLHCLLRVLFCSSQFDVAPLTLLA
mmetsp:Transcript_54310/g.117523  ORF Transcript_54310/g.117523 Transcript_54310/m.117523 type:complete len:210 (+) Transcript_54310:256-885(+)